MATLPRAEAAIKKLQPLYDGGKGEVTAADDTARSDLEAQMRTILGPLAFPGYGPGKLNLDSLYSGDEGFGMLDGLRFDADIGANGEPSGKTGKDGQYVAPKTHILVTTQSLFARWLRAHKIGGTRDRRTCRSRSARRSTMRASTPRRSRPMPPWRSSRICQCARSRPRPRWSMACLPRAPSGGDSGRGGRGVRLGAGG